MPFKQWSVHKQSQCSVDNTSVRYRQFENYLNWQVHNDECLKLHMQIC